MAKKRLSRKKRRRRAIIRGILLVVLLIILTCGILIAPKLKKIKQLEAHAKELVKKSSRETFNGSGTTVIYDSKGQELCTMRDSKDMYYVSFDEIPSALVYAFVVMEDQDFYKHRGIDYKAIIRAIIANSENNTIVQGASTITQQLAKNIFLTQDVTWERKIEELFVARELEKKYSKDEILEFYLNNIYFGNGYYGVEAAARGYFNKNVGELTISEQAFIAAIPNNPTRYNPLTNFENTLARRDNILTRLYDNDYINSMNYYTAIDSEVEISRQPVASKNNSLETYARHCATEGLMQAYGFNFRTNFSSEDDYEQYINLYEESYTLYQQMLFSGGYSVYTSLDTALQEKLQTAIDNNLSDFTSQKDGVYEMQGAATCIDNTTGNVVAIVGSRSQELEGYTLNRAYQSYRQPGSSIKPLIAFLPFLQRGNTPVAEVEDVYDANGPKNADGSYLGVIPLRTAVSLSKNTVAYNIVRELTPRAACSYLINQGFKKVWMDKEYNAIALGGFTYGVSTEEMAAAYATIINDGEYRNATCIKTIENSEGKVILDTADRASVIYDVESSRMMVDMLKTVVEEGTGVGAVPDNAIVAGKTGTTNSNYDSWFCGFSKYYTVAIWQGYDYPAELTSTRTKAIFKDFMESAHVGYKLKEFTKYKAYSKEEQTTEAETLDSTETESDTQSETANETESTGNETKVDVEVSSIPEDETVDITKPDGSITDPDKEVETTGVPTSSYEETTGRRY